jgi:hypothetical protein
MFGPHSCAVGCAQQPSLPSRRENVDWEARQLASPVIEKCPIRVLPILTAGTRCCDAPIAAMAPAPIGFVAGIDFEFVSHK